MPVNIWYEIDEEGDVIFLTLAHVIDEANVQRKLGVNFLAEIPVDISLGFRVTVNVSVRGVQEVQEVVAYARLKGVELSQ